VAGGRIGLAGSDSPRSALGVYGNLWPELRGGLENRRLEMLKVTCCAAGAKRVRWRGDSCWPERPFCRPQPFGKIGTCRLPSSGGGPLPRAPRQEAPCAVVRGPAVLAGVPPENIPGIRKVLNKWRSLTSNSAPNACRPSAALSVAGVRVSTWVIPRGNQWRVTSPGQESPWDEQLEFIFQLEVHNTAPGFVFEGCTDLLPNAWRRCQRSFSWSVVVFQPTIGRRLTARWPPHSS